MNWKDCLNYLTSSGRITTKIIFFLLLLTFASAKSYSQSEQIKSDSVQTDTAKFEMKKSPWGAVLRSAIIPGFGQLYNESYWKIPVVWGTLGYLGYLWIDRNDLYKTYRDLYNQSLIDSETGNGNYYRLREDYKDQRDLVAVFIGLTYFLNLVDAYVDAHLFDFDVSEGNGISMINFNMRINF